jgi:hypothetical protein
MVEAELNFLKIGKLAKIKWTKAESEELKKAMDISDVCGLPN